MTDGRAGNPVPTGPVDLEQVACPGGPTCVATGVTASGTGVISWLTKGAVTKTVAVPQANYWSALSCTKSYVCAAVGMNYVKASSGTVEYGFVASVIGSILPAEVMVVGAKASLEVLASSATTASAVCPSTGHCVDFGVVSPNTRGEHGFVAAAAGGKLGTAITVPGSADVYALSCPVLGSCVGIASDLHGAYGDYSEGIFTLDY